MCEAVPAPPEYYVSHTYAIRDFENPADKRIAGRRPDPREVHRVVE
jgi:hypothetical protein